MVKYAVLGGHYCCHWHKCYELIYIERGRATLMSNLRPIALSAGYLGRLFKQTAGQSFVEALTACRLKAAARMLVETDTPVAVISREVGMENASYFSTVFRKAYGMSPSLYRETNQSATQKQQEGETKE